MTVQISNELALDLLESELEKALEVWGNVADKGLFMDMYEKQLLGGTDFIDFDPMCIVDNDVVNHCSVVRESEHEEDYNKLLELWNNDECEVESGTLEYFRGALYIEAFDMGKFLIRHI